jgi:hypothetical protein
MCHTYTPQLSLMLCYICVIDSLIFLFFCRMQPYLQSVPVHSANAVRTYTKGCRRVLTTTLLSVMGSEPSCDLGNLYFDGLPELFCGTG